MLRVQACVVQNVSLSIGHRGGGGEASYRVVDEQPTARSSQAVPSPWALGDEEGIPV